MVSVMRPSCYAGCNYANWVCILIAGATNSLLWMHEDFYYASMSWIIPGDFYVAACWTT